MGRPKGSKNTAKIPKKICSACQIEKRVTDFYKSYNLLHRDGRMPVCKQCIHDSCYDNDGDFSLDGFKSILRQVDRPFISELWDKSYSEVLDKVQGKRDMVTDDAIVGIYLKNLALKQNRDLTWDDSRELDTSIDITDINENTKIESGKRKSLSGDRVYYLSDDKFKVTEKIIRFFGEGYTAKEYEIMQRIYNDTKLDYPNVTNSQKNLLLRYVRLAAKEEIATSCGDTSAAEKWAKLSSEALKQLNSIDVQGGVTCFSEFFQKFEQVKDISRILPKFKYRPNDAPDFIIWCYINYCRRLEGKTEIEYSDIYKFYDEKVAQYIEQYGDPYGLFENDTTLNNRSKIEDFIKMPDDFEDAD